MRAPTTTKLVSKTRKYKSVALTKRCRGQKREDDGVARFVTLEDFALDQGLGSIASKFLLHLLFCLAKSKRLRLSKIIG
jgi:hypothetical protein